MATFDQAAPLADAFSPDPALPRSPIQTSYEDHIGVIAFDDYAKRNALSGEMIAAILGALEVFKTGRARGHPAVGAERVGLVFRAFHRRAAQGRSRPPAL